MQWFVKTVCTKSTSLKYELYDSASVLDAVKLIQMIQLIKGLEKLI